MYPHGFQVGIHDPGTGVPIAYAVQMASLPQVRVPDALTAEQKRELAAEQARSAQAYRASILSAQTLAELPSQPPSWWYKDVDYCSALGRICAATRSHDLELAELRVSRHKGRFSGRITYSVDRHRLLGTRLWHLPLKDEATHIAQPAVAADGTLYKFGRVVGHVLWAVKADEAVRWTHAEYASLRGRTPEVEQVNRMSSIVRNVVQIGVADGPYDRFGDLDLQAPRCSDS